MKKVYQSIYQKALPYLRQGRRWDLRHTQQIIPLAERVAQRSYLQADVLVPTAILHDIGWSQVPQRILTTYRSTTARRMHMERGARLADDILRSVQYPTAERQRVVHLVSVHDNPSSGIGKQLQSRYEKVFRDIDLLWRFTHDGFWKDIVERQIMNPSDFLAAIITKANTEGAFRNPHTRRLWHRFISARRREIKKKPTTR